MMITTIPRTMRSALGDRPADGGTAFLGMNVNAIDILGRGLN